MEVEFQLIPDFQASVLLSVPILAARDKLVYPIIHGYDVIEEMIRNKGQRGSKVAIVDVMSFALVDVNVESVSKKACVFEELYINSLAVPAGQTVAILCYVSCGPLGRRTPALFEPTPDET